MGNHHRIVLGAAAIALSVVAAARGNDGRPSFVSAPPVDAARVSDDGAAETARLLRSGRDHFWQDRQIIR